MKSRRFTIILILLVFVVGFFILTRDNPNELKVVIHNLDEESATYDIHLEYPQFPGLSKNFNQKIENLVDESLQSFKDSVNQNEAARVETGGETLDYQYTLNLGWSPEQLNSEIVSIVIRQSYYTGGAHGGHEVETFSYDVENREELTLEKIFENTPNYLERISQFSQDSLKRELRRQGDPDPNISLIQSGTVPLPKNFSRFTLGADSTITFYFPQYQVAPYAAGEQTVVMPLSYLMNTSRNN